MTPDILLTNIINHYKATYSNRDRHIIHCSNQPNLGSAIFQAAIARDNTGKKHKHQYLIPNQLLELFAIHLSQDEISFRSANTFEMILAIIEKNVFTRTTLKGIGEMAIYDTAIRIGAYKGIKPDKIYLHRGTRIGAKKLIPGKKLGSFITKADLPKPFQIPTLTDAEIEDILCIYKSKFR